MKTSKQAAAALVSPPSADWSVGGGEPARGKVMTVKHARRVGKRKSAPTLAEFNQLVQEVKLLRMEVRELEAARLAATSPLAPPVAVNPLAAARARGATYMTAELNNPDNLSLEEAAMAAGRSDRAINEDRKLGALYALLPHGKTRGYRYPRWQFAVDPARLKPVLQKLREHEVSMWGQHAFLTQASSFLEAGITPKDALMNTKLPLRLILEAVDAQFDDEQGA